MDYMTGLSRSHQWMILTDIRPAGLEYILQQHKLQSSTKMNINSQHTTDVTGGPHDAVCPLKSYQLCHETQMPQSEVVMLHAKMNERMRRHSKLRMVTVWQVDAEV